MTDLVPFIVNREQDRPTGRVAAPWMNLKIGHATVGTFDVCRTLSVADRPYPQLQIPRPIISPITVFMVDGFPFYQRSSEHPSHYQSVLMNLYAVFVSVPEIAIFILCWPLLYWATALASNCPTGTAPLEIVDPLFSVDITFAGHTKRRLTTGA